MRRSILSGTVAAAVAFAGSAAAYSLGQSPSAASQAKPVAAAQLVRAVDIPAQQFTLPNGLRVVVHEDRKAPVVAIAAWYNVGSKDEPKGQTGFAHLFEHIMLFNGTENMQSGLMEPLRAMGATDWNGTTWYDRTNYFQTVPTAALESALYMESDRMGHLLGALTQERLDNQRGVVQNEKRQRDNQPYGLDFYKISEALFPEGHPYRHSTIGSMEDLDRASLDQVRQWFRDNYGPNNAVLVLAGDIDLPTAKRLVQRYFGHIPKGPQNIPAAADVPTLKAPLSERTTDRVAGTRLYRAWAVPGLLHKDAAALDIGARVLGGLSSSRLDKALVRQEQTAVSVSSSLQSFQRVGMFIVTVDVKPGVDADAVSKRLDTLLADYLATGPSADELQRVAVSEIAARTRGLDQSGGFSGKAVALAEGTLYADDPTFYKRRLQEYGAATPASVTAAMKRWLTRPVYALRVDPGQRPSYTETAGAKKAASAPASAIAVKPREPMPPVGEVANLNFPAIERGRLSNGIPVTYARRPNSPVVRIAVEFDAGLAADPADKLGSHQLMLNLLTAGTTSRDSIEIAEQAERLGVVLGANASLDRSAVNLASLSANLAPSIELLSDVVRNPAFTPSEVERIRGQQLATIANELTQPAAMAQRAFLPRLYGASHPYGRPASGTGDAAAVKAIKRDDLLAAHASWIRPDAAHIFAVGDLPLSQLLPMLEKGFGTWTAPASAKGTKAFVPPSTPQGTRIFLVDRPQSPQSYILAGTVTPVTGAQNDLELEAANEVLSGDFLARINQDLRETRGWSYGVSGAIPQREHHMPLFIQAPVQTNQTGPSVKAILDHVRSFNSDKGVTEAELKRVIAGNTRELAGSFETSAALLAALRTNALYRRPDDFWTKVAAQYRGMSAASLDAAARKAINPAGMTVVVVGDASVVRPQLDALGLPVEQISLAPAP
jgi:predicted Zn-dependent peptidase